MSQLQETSNKNKKDSSSVFLAHGLFFNNFLLNIRITWVYALISAIAIGLGYFIYARALDVEVETILPLIGFALSGIISFCALIIFFIMVMRILNKRSLRWNAIRVLITALFLILLHAIIISLNIILFLVLRNVSLALCLGVPALVDILIIAFFLPLIYGFLRYFQDEEMGFKNIFSSLYKEGLNNWGRLFVYALIVCLLKVVIFLPFIIIVLSHALSIYGINYMTDPSGLPRNFNLLQFVVCSLTWFIYLYVSMFIMFVLYFLTSKISEKEKLKKSKQQVAQQGLYKS